MENEKDITLEAVNNEARAIESELNKLDANDTRPATRKMRFADDSGNASFNRDKLFMPKRDISKYSFEEIALGRMLLNARGEVLPDAMESRFQSLADKATKYTMTTDGSGTGSELIDTVMWNQLFQDIVSQTLVAGLFTPWVDMPSQSMELPSLGDVTFYKPAGEGQAVTATDLATAKRTLTAYTLKAQVDVSDEESEDAVIAMIPEIATILRRNAQQIIDEAILCADNSTGKENVNYYYPTSGADIATSSRFLLGFDGLIHYCLNEVTGNVSNVGAALDAAKIRAILALMGKYGVNPDRVAFVTDLWNKNVLLGLTELQTVDKMGPKATILTGEIGAIYGSPVIISTALAKSCSTGQVHQTGGNNTKGRFIAVNRDMWKFGVRRNIRVATERSESKTLTSIVVTMRIGLQCYGDRSSAGYTHAILGYNCTI